jgi:galactokinase
MDDFQRQFGYPPSAQSDAPGRVNLIGEHTDYNGGFVLPTAIPQRTHVALAVRPDRTVRVRSTALGAEGELRSYDFGSEHRGGTWLDYIQGVTMLLRQGGFSLSGMDILIDSQVPVGSGLSSSAALTVSLMRGLRQAFSLALNDVAIARFGQRVENEFVGAQVGIMDPMAASLADDGTALFLDARSLHFERVPLPEGADLVVIHSGVSHSHAAGDYNTRRRECEEAARLLGVPQLRDLTISDLERVQALPPPLNRRARHVVTENARVEQAVAAMRAGDLERLGKLFNASHDSMRDDYEVSIPVIDLLVEFACADPAVYGARLTGGGFGGSVVILAQRDLGSQVAQSLVHRYAQRSGLQARILVPMGES